jgi:hypothetical protein
LLEELLLYFEAELDDEEEPWVEDWPSLLDELMVSHLP